MNRPLDSTSTVCYTISIDRMKSGNILTPFLLRKYLEKPIPESGPHNTVQYTIDVVGQILSKILKCAIQSDASMSKYIVYSS